jgi:hypothetical protein
MIGYIWDRVATLIRPDLAELVPDVDFDPNTGTLSVQLGARVRGKTTWVDMRTLTRGRGTLGGRAFRLPPETSSTLMRAAESMRSSDPDTLTCEQDRVPEVVALLRGS